MITIPDVFLSNFLFLLLVVGVWFASLAVISPGTGIYEVLTLFTMGGVVLGLVYLPFNGWAFIPLLLGFAAFLSSLWVKKWDEALLIISAILFSVGSIYLFRSEWNHPAVNPVLAIVVSLSTLGFYWFAIRKSVAAYRLRSIFDPSSVLDQIGEVRTDLDPVGTVYVGGELWSAISERRIPVCARVRVLERKGLLLRVELVEQPHTTPSEKGEE
jgi:membrane-bound serine protease (ClpP class)